MGAPFSSSPNAAIAPGCRHFFLSGEASPVSATSPDAIAEVIAAYLTENPTALLVEDGRVLFDFAVAHYSAAAERERCLLQV